ncbi:MAG: amidohydrolase [Chloroflexi bacterium]|nr:amidohydrolase [Chloroflexota bacterium]
MTSSIGKADTVIKNANIITIDTSRPKAQALAMTHGRFAGVGSNEDLEGLIGPGTKVLDLGGKTVLPGFIDAHIHVLSSGIRHVMAADCDVPTLKQVQAGLKERAGKTPAGQWVQGFKFDDTKTDRTASNEGRHLYRDDLDAVTTAHPILVAHRAGHVYYMNTAALEAAGFNDETPDPPGGRLGRDPDTGRLNGMIFERAIDPVRFGLIPVETEEVRREGLRTICGMLNRAGLTSVHDARVTAEEFQTYQDGKAAGELSLRVYALMWYPQFPALRDAGIKSGLGDDLLRIGGIKMVADGAIATRTAYLSQPYEGSQCDHGILAMEQDEIEEQVMAMHRAGFQVCIHANGDLTIDMVLTAYEKAQKAHPRVNTRHRIEHCTLVNEDLLMRMKALGCIATPFCTYVYHHGEKMRYYGEQRLEWMFAQRSFIDSGVVSTGATDYPPGPFEPLLGIQSCVTRTDSTGKEWGVNQRVSVEEALRLYTLNGAYASFEEDSKGSIETGKLADLVVLGSDPNKVDPLGIKDIAVERTIVGGETVYGG